MNSMAKERYHMQSKWATTLSLSLGEGELFWTYLNIPRKCLSHWFALNSDSAFINLWSLDLHTIGWF